MAIKIYEKFSPRANPADANYPYGSIKNESVPGAKDGTPLNAAWGNDYVGFDAALLAEAGIAPSGLPDTVGSSQRLEAIKAIGDKRHALTFKTTDEVVSSTELSTGQKVVWQGYYSQSDGGGNWGIVKVGAHVEDGGSIFSIDANTYIEANLKGKTINALKFGLISDVNTTTRLGSDNYPQLLNAIKYAATSIRNSSVHIPDGKYYLSQGINFDDVPLNDSEQTDYRRSLRIRGENKYRTQLWLASGQTYHFKSPFDISGNTYRSLDIGDFTLMNCDLGDVSNVNNPLYAEGGLQLFNNPYSIISNIQLFWIKQGIHVRTSWFTRIKNITCTRVSHTGIFIDGDDGDGGYGFTQYVTVKDAIVGMRSLYSGESQGGIRIRGSNDHTLTNIDSEFGKAPAILVEGTANTKVNNLHIEGSATAQPIVIKPLTGWEDDLLLWTRSFCLDGASIATSAVSSVIVAFPGVTGISAKNAVVEILKGSDSTVNDSIQLVSLSNVANTQDTMHKIGNIQVWDNNTGFEELTYLNTVTPNTTAFRWGGNTVIEKGTNQTYYGATLNMGDTYMLPDNNTVHKVTKSGTFGRTISVLGTTVSGSRFVSVDDSAQIDVNTFMLFGTVVKRVVAVDRIAHVVECETPFTVNQSGVGISYSAPTLLPVS